MMCWHGLGRQFAYLPRPALASPNLPQSQSQQNCADSQRADTAESYRQKNSSGTQGGTAGTSHLRLAALQGEHDRHPALQKAGVVQVCGIRLRLGGGIPCGNV